MELAGSMGDRVATPQPPIERLIAVGYGLIQSSRNKLKNRHMVPRRAARQAKETVEWAKEQVS